MSQTQEANRYRDHQRAPTIAERTHGVKTPPTIGIVVDTQNLYTRAFSFGDKPRLDYQRIIGDVAAGAAWVGIACVARPLTNKPIDGFLAFVRTLGLTPVVWQSPVAAGKMKVNLDALVVREATCLAVEAHLKEICIVGSDCDYYVVAELCRQRGIKFSVAGFSHSIGGFMRAQADRVVELGQDHLIAEAA